MKFIKATNYEDMSKKVANIIFSQVTLKPDSVLGLATGSTPIGAYEQLVKWYQEGQLDFSKVTSINLDEYCGLTPENDQSYCYFMEKHLFSKINIDKNNTNVPNGTANPTVECLRYEEVIATAGGIDLQLLGLGHNGHIGFNEPADTFAKLTNHVQLTQTTIEANKRFFSSIEEVPTSAITMGLGAIMQAKTVVLAVNGKDKAEILNKVMNGPITPQVPASILQLHNNCIVVASVQG